LFDERHKHQPVEDGHATEGDEANGGAHRQRHAAQRQQRDAAHGTKRDSGRDHQDIAKGTEAEVQKDEDQAQRHRNDDHQAPVRPLHVFELAAPLDRVPLGERDLVVDASPAWATKLATSPSRTLH
jgi:hypothetical protein